MAKPVLTVVRGIRQRALDASSAADLKARIAAICREVPGADALLPAFLHDVDRETTPSERWDFDMVSFREQAVVLQLIRTQAKRPMLSLALWEALTTQLDPGSGIVRLNRRQLANGVGARENEVSTAMAEFVAWNVLLRYTSGRTVLWRLNPNIATRLPAAAGDQQRKAAGPVLRLVPRDDEGVISDPRQPDLV